MTSAPVGSVNPAATVNVQGAPFPLQPANRTSTSSEPTGVIPGVEMAVDVPDAVLADVARAVPPVHAERMATPSEEAPWARL